MIDNKQTHTDMNNFLIAEGYIIQVDENGENPKIYGEGK